MNECETLFKKINKKINFETLGDLGMHEIKKFTPI